MARSSPHLPAAPERRIHSRLATAAGAAIPAAVAALALIVASGCDHHDGGRAAASPTTPPRPSSSSSPDTTEVERDALAAYRGMWDAWIEAGKTSNPDAPALRTYLSSDALKSIVGTLATNQHNQQVSLGTVALDPKIAEIKPPGRPTAATVSDCVDTTKWLNYRASGGLVDDVPGGRQVMTATVSFTDGRWTVKAFKLGRVGTC